MGGAELGFGVIGAGWRTDFFLRVADAVPGLHVSGIVARRAERAAELEARWQVPCFDSLDAMLLAGQPKFVIASVPPGAMPAACKAVAERGLPVLAETPPAPDLDGLVALNEFFRDGGHPIQVAEQYWAQPLHAARQAVVDSGTLGPVNQVYLSVCHGYHAMSLLRRLLGVGAENAVVSGRQFRARLLAGPDRAGPPTAEKLVDESDDYAILDFGDRMALYDFCLPQYRNWIRGQRVCIRGERGEIIDREVRYLQDLDTPVSASIVRHEAGRDGNLEGMHLKGMQFLDRWVYRNPVAPARLSDEEIAVARCIIDMGRYVDTGQDFYSLAEASQDQYLALCCAQAIATGTSISTETQPWADQI